METKDKFYLSENEKKSWEEAPIILHYSQIRLFFEKGLELLSNIHNHKFTLSNKAIKIISLEEMATRKSKPCAGLCICTVSPMKIYLVEDKPLLVLEHLSHEYGHTEGRVLEESLLEEVKAFAFQKSFSLRFSEMGINETELNIHRVKYSGRYGSVLHDQAVGILNNLKDNFDSASLPFAYFNLFKELAYNNKINTENDLIRFLGPSKNKFQEEAYKCQK
ncbi:MAG: hypothetical protein WCX73_02985 [Candidatus Pacearchaeota archaeon]|jgi:hypothetical protein